jgi:galactokinase
MEDVFESLFDHSPGGVWSAPGRVNLIGEHVDYNEGLVMPLAIEKRAAVTVGLRSDRVVRVASVQKAGVVTASLDGPSATGWSAHVLGVAWALQQQGIALPGFELLVDSDIPIGAGLSSSAGLGVATCLALNDLLDLGLSPLDIAMVCHRAETGYVGAPVGVMDHVVSACATEGHALLLDCRTLERQAIPLSLSGHAFVVVDTRVQHDNNDGSYATRRAACERAAGELGVKALRDVEGVSALDALADDLRPTARHVVSEIARVREAAQALRAQDALWLGQLLLASHESLARDFRVSCRELDLVVAAAMGAGALGARLTGAGLGGCAIALVPDDSVVPVTAAVRRALQSNGHHPPDVYPVRPAAGACRVR